MLIISLITPVYQPTPDHLIAAYRSIREQKLPCGWELEWLVQEDGTTSIASSILPQESWIHFGTGRHNGVAITRNLALSRSRGEFVKNLDQDDILTSGTLARDIAALTEGTGILWTTSRVLDLLPDGSTLGFDDDPPPGRLEPGVVLAHWRSHNYRLPVHPTTICIRRQLAVALGGWMAVPGSDDTGLLISASVISPGYFEPEVGLLYRKWPGQQSAGTDHTEAIEWNARMALISERADALGQLVARTDQRPTLW